MRPLYYVGQDFYAHVLDQKSLCDRVPGVKCKNFERMGFVRSRSIFARRSKTVPSDRTVAAHKFRTREKNQPTALKIRALKILAFDTGHPVT